MQKWILSACTALALPAFAFAPQPPAAADTDVQRAALAWVQLLQM